MRFNRFGASLLVAGIALLGVATPALAHSELKSSDPARGASLATPPTQIKLTFSGPVTLADDPIQITGPENASWTVGRAEVAGMVVTAPVQAVGPAGEYTLRYKVTFEDTHAASGSVKFNLTAPVAPPSSSSAPTSSQAPASSAAPAASAAPAPAAEETTPDNLVPTWVWIVLAVAVVVAGLVVALRFVRRKND
ncbi:copper resistance CopC family protein [Amycolatopsis sp. BJA-103]|uniref:copper resistance CopC family protein n=1 Tax=unclassified Amycolatopsis TaxID=2618356 RepID=UPI000C794988|nr:copper resistance CopC family protein [Amycolatopsis sp. BJA-103]AUI62873.1 copper resistance protein CopC [Amycolatopsis sp. BJA-103]PNE18713.1 copper resistance protein CopC [Amycolatopsis sp. BJA-103]